MHYTAFGVRLSLLLLILLLSWDPVVADEASDEVDESAVLVLTQKTFSKVIKRNKHVLVQFYAPWCGHCQQLKPKYAAAAKALAEKGAAAKLAKIDATTNPKLGKKYEVEEFPTLLWFDEGKVTKRNPKIRDTGEIIRFVVKRTSPSVMLIDSANSFSKTRELKFAVVGFFRRKDEEALNTFREVAADDHINDYFVVTDDELMEDEAVATTPKIIFYRQFDEPKVRYESKFDKKSIETAVQAYSRPAVVELKEENERFVWENELPKVFLFRAAGEALGSMMLVAEDKDFAGRYVFATAGDEADPELGSELGVNEQSEKPELFLFVPSEEPKKYRLEPPHTVKRVRAFLRKFEKGTLEQFYKSAPVEDGWDSQPVKEITASQWNDFTDMGKHVVVKVYAPWCSHCKELEPKYKKAAEYFERFFPDQVVLAQLDGTRNEVPNLEIGGYPTVLVLTSGQREEPEQLSEQELVSSDEIITGVKDLLKLEVPWTGKRTDL